jgi:hypothetical protein
LTQKAKPTIMGHGSLPVLRNLLPGRACRAFLGYFLADWVDFQMTHFEMPEAAKYAP